MYLNRYRLIGWQEFDEEISDLIVIQLVFHAATLAVMCPLWSLYPTFRDLVIRESLYVVATLYLPLVRYFQRDVGVFVANDRVYPDILMILGDILCFIACWIRVCWSWKSMLSMDLEISSLISLVIKFVIIGNHPRLSFGSWRSTCSWTTGHGPIIVYIDHNCALFISPWLNLCFYGSIPNSRFLSPAV